MKTQYERRGALDTSTSTSTFIELIKSCKISHANDLSINRGRNQAL